ncbi:MAG: threonine-phosphate decarboxylase CobD [Tepidanaerobacteraceae bacterium]|jgi:threonine-phosphate decarboxylase|nr:threonine-phosphate decarboxylase CobD [Tepidanaerobacteraceae bacterium]
MALHGGNVYKAGKELNMPHDKLVDFSANINPLGFPDVVRKIIISRIDDIIHYPDPDQAELKKNAAEYYGVNPENILPGNGSVELINIIMEALKPSKVLIFSPTFSEYARSCRSRGIKVELVDMTKNDCGWDIELVRKMENVICKNSMIIICNPNNPTGKLASKEEITCLLEILQYRKSFLLLDEAFMDFVINSQTLIKDVEKHKNLIILRSLTKVFALPGLRIGFAAGNRELIQKLEELKDPWNINTFAGLAGCEVLKEKSYIDMTRKFISQEKEYLWNKLSDINGLLPFYPEANFVFVKIARGVKSGALADKLKTYGILIRQCGDFDFLDDTYFRVAVRKREENEMLINALTSIYN